MEHEGEADEQKQVPSAVLDCVVDVPVGAAGPGKMREEGPDKATAAYVSSVREETVFALEPQVSDFNEEHTDVCSKIVSLLQQLEELEDAGARSVAVEMASIVRSWYIA